MCIVYVHKSDTKLDQKMTVQPPVVSGIVEFRSFKKVEISTRELVSSVHHHRRFRTLECALSPHDFITVNRYVPDLICARSL